MGKLIDHGWYSFSDAIPQSTSVLLGANLTRNSAPASTPPKLDPDGNCRRRQPDEQMFGAE
jgi:hypothetical protein